MNMFLLTNMTLLLWLLFVLNDSAAEVKDNQPPLIIVSLDGMDWRVLKSQLSQTTNLNFIAQTGVKAEYIKNVMPTSTWPNHHTILTGLYPESHGIVDNRFWDPLYEEKFIFSYDCSNFDPKFYNASEPIWLSLQKQGGRSASYFWPATTSYSIKPTYYEKETCFGIDCSAIDSKDLPKYRNRTLPPGSGLPYVHCVFDLRGPWSARVDKAVEWLSLEKPPHFIALYFEQPDAVGHSHGVSSQEYRQMVENVDANAVGYLLKRLNESSFLLKVNLIVVSDHGIEDTPSSRRVYLDDYIDPSSYTVIHTGSVPAHIWPKPGMIDIIYQNLTRNPIPHVREVYRKEDIPDAYHWKNNRRIPPIFIDTEVGWVVTRSRNDTLQDRGSHGWPPDQSKSYSIFYARGPAFREGVVVNPFSTVDLYPLMSKLLGIKPHPNNGSMENVKAVLKERQTNAGKVLHHLCLRLVMVTLFMAFAVVNN